MKPMSSNRRSAQRAEAIPARDDETEAQVIHLPAAMIAEMEACAEDLGRSVDWCVSTAWCVATADFERDGGTRASDEGGLLGGKMSRRRIALPLLTWRHITQEAERLDRSKSWLLQRAWLIARGRLPRS